jgi:hypothetical protein
VTGTRQRTRARFLALGIAMALVATGCGTRNAHDEVLDSLHGLSVEGAMDASAVALCNDLLGAPNPDATLIAAKDANVGEIRDALRSLGVDDDHNLNITSDVEDSHAAAICVITGKYVTLPYGEKYGALYQFGDHAGSGILTVWS